MAVAEELQGVDVDALREWFAVAARTQVRLWQGAGRLADALPLLAAGWSSPAPRLAIARQADAGLTSHRIIEVAVDAADQAGAILRQCRALTSDELSATEAALLGLGWPPDENLVDWATRHSQLVPVTSIMINLATRLGDLRTRNTQALQLLATALRSDPRDPVQALQPLGPPAAPEAGVAGPTGGSGRVGSARGGGMPASSALTGAAGVDRDNQDRLTADLHSSDVATLAMALGVRAALEKARTSGGVAQLLVYESAGSGSQGRAAIGVGDISTADNIATLAPGVSNAPVNMAEGITSAVALRAESQRLAPGDATAVVAWYGYDIPLSAIRGVPVDPLTAAANTAAALTDVNARAGGALLVQDINRFHQLAPATARFVAVGFSMGATTVSAAAARGADIDDLVMLGSPGAGGDVRTAHDYPDLPAEHAFALSYDQDPITQTVTDVLAGAVGGIGHLPTGPGPFGPDPASGDFDAQVIDAESNAPDPTVRVSFGPFPDLLGSAVANEVADLAAHHQEANYYSGAALSAIASVTVGLYTDVPIKPGR
jgi:hypothetical protein